MYLIYPMKNDFPTIVITGATKGIGKATAELFATKGFNIAFCARNANDVAEVAEALQKINPAVTVISKTCDVSNKNEAMEFCNYVLEHCKRIDILVNNAGTFIPGNIYDEEEGVLEKTIDTNLLSAYNISRQILKRMLPQKSGHIFNLCSVASIGAYEGGGSYAISKAGLLGFSKNLRHELKEKQIKVTALIVGATYTASWEGATDFPIERFIPAEDIAKIIFNAYDTSASTVIEEILIRPQLGDI